jgi:hypothetical protein
VATGFARGAFTGAILLLAACSPAATPTPRPTSTAPAHTMMGTFTLGPSSSFIGGTDFCRGTGAYDDIKAGAEVTVKNESGKIIGTSQLTDQPIRVPEDKCVLNFQVTSLPVADSYSIAVGRRGEMTYSYADMQKANWMVALTVGG